MKPIRLLLILFFLVSESFAQTSTGSITGFLTDRSDSALAEAQVTLTDNNTGRQRTTTTNNSGQFTLVQLPPSTYTLQLSHSGFATLQARGIVLQLGQEINRNFTLDVESSQSTVTVESGTTALDIESARIGGNVSPREIQNLPINGRQISQLYLLVPGATNSGSGTFDNIRFSGRSVEQNIIRLDGIEATSVIDTSPAT